MKIAHSLVIAPGLCGLYESAKEIILAERAMGHDAFPVEPDGASLGKSDPELSKRGVVPYDTDVIIDHSGCDKSMLDSDIPIVHLRHGRPLSTFLIEHKGGIKAYSNLAAIGRNPRYVAVATMWQEHVPYLRELMGCSIGYIPAPVDLEKFSPDGPRHDFGGRGGKNNYVIADMWRDDCCPFDAVQSFMEIKGPDDKLHVYGIQKSSSAMTAMLKMVGKSLGEVGWAKNMAPIYRSADRVITCSNIATRVVREALACGCPVTSTVENQWTIKSGEPREIAKRYFNPKASALALLDIAERSMATA